MLSLSRPLVLVGRQRTFSCSSFSAQPPLQNQLPSSRLTCQNSKRRVLGSASLRKRTFLRLILPSTAAALLVMASTAGAKEPRPGEIVVIDGRSIYTVALGNSLSGIAQRFGTTVEILVQANQLETSIIVPGQRLWVPRTYTIQKGDTLYAIARKYGTTLQEILKVNNIPDPNKINAGDIMLLP